MMIIFAFKKREFKEKTHDADLSLLIKNPNPLLKKRIPDSDSPKIGRIPDSDSDCELHNWDSARMIVAVISSFLKSIPMLVFC